MATFPRFSESRDRSPEKMASRCQAGQTALCKQFALMSTRFCMRKRGSWERRSSSKPTMAHQQVSWHHKGIFALRGRGNGGKTGRRVEDNGTYKAGAGGQAFYDVRWARGQTATTGGGTASARVTHTLGFHTGARFTCRQMPALGHGRLFRDLPDGFGY
ncbi:hypothetical protein Bbelb_337290 [Branchiostoma belcheri]|nr:hypothetical protein Bbelb_337290 [Branchiostoma belcheri]